MALEQLIPEEVRKDLSAVKGKLKEFQDLGSRDTYEAKQLLRQILYGAIFSGVGYMGAEAILPSRIIPKQAAYLIRSALRKPI
jgi:hypothetical protein